MVVLRNFQDIIESLPEADSFSLPVFKQNSLKIEFSTNEVSFIIHFYVLYRDISLKGYCISS